MHQTNQRGHNETSTATTQNQLAYKACRRWREVSARPDATCPVSIHLALVSLKMPHLLRHRHLNIGRCHVPEDARRRRVEIEHFGSGVLEPSFSCAAEQLCDVMTCMCVGDLLRIVWPRPW